MKNILNLFKNSKKKLNVLSLVNIPLDAFNYLMGTELDKLVIGNCYLDKKSQDPSLKKHYKKEFELD